MKACFDWIDSNRADFIFYNVIPIALAAWCALWLRSKIRARWRINRMDNRPGLRVVEGRVRDFGMHGLIIVTDEVRESGWGAEELFDGMMGKRVRVTVEVLDGSETPSPLR